MKKIINEPSNFVEESIEGLVKSHPDIYAFAPDNKRVITRAKKSSNKVGIVSGGGSGHLPVFTGYVGKGLLDACAVGSVFASPSVDQIASAIRNADNGSEIPADIKQNQRIEYIEREVERLRDQWLHIEEWDFQAKIYLKEIKVIKLNRMRYMLKLVKK